MKLMPYRRVLCASYNRAPCHFMQRHKRKMYACLAVTCRLHFWQNDRGLLRATAVTRAWNEYRNKSQHRKSTLEKKILTPLQQVFEPATFRSRVRRSNHWAIPAPRSSSSSPFAHSFIYTSIYSRKQSSKGNAMKLLLFLNTHFIQFVQDMFRNIFELTRRYKCYIWMDSKISYTWLHFDRIQVCFCFFFHSV